MSLTRITKENKVTLEEYRRLTDREMIRHTKVLGELNLRLKITQQTCPHTDVIDVPNPYGDHLSACNICGLSFIGVSPNEMHKM